MPKRPDDEEHHPIERTTEHGDGFKWGGMRKEGSRASIPANQFQHLENVRFQGGDIIARPGLAKDHTAALEGPLIIGIHEPKGEVPFAKGDSPYSNFGERIYYMVNNPVAGAGLFIVGGSIYNEQGGSMVLFNSLSPLPGEQILNLMAFGGEILGMQIDGSLTDVDLYRFTDSAQVKLADFPFSDTMNGVQRYSSVVGTDGLFISITYSDAFLYRTEVFLWNGSTLVLDEDFGVAGNDTDVPVLAVKTTGEPVIFFTGAGNHAQHRVGAGNWVATAYTGDQPATLPEAPSPYAAARRGDIIHVGSSEDPNNSGPNFWINEYNPVGPVYANGSAAALTSPGFTGQLTNNIQLEVFGGDLYYAHGYVSDPGGSISLHVGRYEGATYTDQLYDVLADFPDMEQVYALISDGTTLFLVANTTAVGPELFRVIGSQTPATQDPWTDFGTMTRETGLVHDGVIFDNAWALTL